MNFTEDSDDDELEPTVRYAFILQEEEYEDEGYDPSGLEDNFEDIIEVQGWDGFGMHLNFFHIQY